MTPRTILDVGRARWSTILLVLGVQMALVLLLLTQRRQLLVPIGRATGWLIPPDLIAGGVLLAVVVGGVIFLQGRLRPKDVGLIASHLPVALLVTLGFWGVTQAVLLAAALSRTGSVALHPQWANPGWSATLGFLVAMLVGMALYEEVAMRGFLFPQLYLRLGGGHRSRLLLAALLSSVLFSLSHVPTRLLMSQMATPALLRSLVVLTFAGLFGVVMYVRTGNLLVVTGIHALVNAPTQIVESPMSPFVVTVVLSAVLWLVWPVLAAELRSRAGSGQPGLA